MTVTLTATHAAVLPSMPSSISVPELIAQGKPFVEFPKYSILDLRCETGLGGAEGSGEAVTSGNGTGGTGSTGFADWLTRKLQIGHPFVIQGFDKLPEWDKQLFSIDGLIDLSTKKNIPIRNCSTNRDLSFTLKKFADAARQSYREFRNFYARDLQCPQEWLDQCSRLLPPELQYGGRADLFQWLPPCARSEVMMAYVGSEGSSYVAHGINHPGGRWLTSRRSGFHRCFSSTVALNLLVETHDRPVICFGTDFESQVKYDAFMAARGASPHVDWLNLGPEELKKADFPIYVCEQNVGDLVVFPPATAHQVWNMGTLSTKMVWNILHPLSLEAGLNYVQPPFNRLCHPDVARTNLSLACAMLSLLKEDSSDPLPPDLPLLTRLFRQMMQDELIEDTPATSITLVQIPTSVIATCDFCGTAIWNRHVRCTECKDFDLCLLCFLSGRSCEHVSSYAWAEIVPQETCEKVLQRAGEILGNRIDDSRLPERKKSLGTAVNDLMKARRSTSTRLCHLCRIDHLEWKGRRCDTCTAFFCFRGLYRHFDMYAADVMRHSGLWICPKCLETCNCRCCHFPTAYVKAEKPASKRRVKPADPRGKIMGFTDNVFDQKKRNVSTPSSSSTHAAPSTDEPRGQKRPLPVSDLPPSSRPLASHHRQRSIVGRGSQSPESESQPRSANEKAYTHAPIDSNNSLDPILHSPLLLRPPNGGDNGSNPRSVAGDGFLNGIDYMSQNPPSTQRDRHISLPPIKTQPFLPPSTSATSGLPSGGMNTLATAAGSQGKISVPGLPEETLRGEKPYHVDPGGAVMSPLASAAAAAPASHPGHPQQSTSHSPSHFSNNPSIHPHSPSQQNPNTISSETATSSGPQSQIQTQPQTSPSPTTTTTTTTNTTTTTTSSPCLTSHTTPTSQPTPHSTNPTNHTQAAPDPTDPTPNPLPSLESKLLRLRHYADELLALSLHESHALLQREINALDETIMRVKRERSERLLRGLESEFPALVGVREGIRREGERLGYF